MRRRRKRKRKKRKFSWDLLKHEKQERVSFDIFPLIPDAVIIVVYFIEPCFCCSLIRFFSVFAGTKFHLKSKKAVKKVKDLKKSAPSTPIHNGSVELRHLPCGVCESANHLFLMLKDLLRSVLKAVLGSDV